MFFNIKNHFKLYQLFTFLILIGCQLQEPLKTHGIIYLENRAQKLTIMKSNKNDVIKIMGRPQIKSDGIDNTWIYVERILSKGKYHKLGQHIVKENKVLILNFDKYGVLNKKKLLNKEDINKITFSDKETQNEMSQKSFVQKFLQSIKQKMYTNRK
jgi:outer membrane protein assembly factor BamE (lipoprotein component of BamABCDE complex)